MRIIAQKSNTLNTNDFIDNVLNTSYISALSLNITYTKDGKIVVFNSNTLGVAITNTINQSTLEQLQNYEIILLNDVLERLSSKTIKKDVYINLVPSDYGIVSDNNIEFVNQQRRLYVNHLNEIISKYSSLSFHLHSINRNLVSILLQEVKNVKIGFAFTGSDFNFIDVNYYVLISNSQNDTVIDMLLANSKDVIIYIASDYYISYLYEHYLGEKSTPHLQQVFSKLSFMTNYPEITYKLFAT